MKKIAILLLIILFVSLTTGCANNNVSQDTINQILSQNEELQKQIDDLKKSQNTTMPITEVKTTETPATTEAREEPPDGLFMDEWEITSISAEIVDKIDNNYGSFVPDKGNKYFLLHITIKNTATTSKTFLPALGLNKDVNIKIIYQDKYEYSSSTLLGYSDDLHMCSLNPLTSKSGIVAFQIIEEASFDKLKIQFSSGDDIREFTFKT